MEKFIFIEG